MSEPTLSFRRSALDRLMEIRDDPVRYPGGFAEAIHLFSRLKEISARIASSPDGWNIRLVTMGVIVYARPSDESHSSVYFVCPSHLFCIAVIVQENGRWTVTEIGTREEVLLSPRTTRPTRRPNV